MCKNILRVNFHESAVPECPGKETPPSGSAPPGGRTPHSLLETRERPAGCGGGKEGEANTEGLILVLQGAVRSPKTEF